MSVSQYDFLFIYLQFAQILGDISKQINTRYLSDIFVAFLGCFYTKFKCLYISLKENPPSFFVFSLPSLFQFLFFLCFFLADPLKQQDSNILTSYCDSSLLINHCFPHLGWG